MYRELNPSDRTEAMLYSEELTHALLGQQNDTTRFDGGFSVCLALLDPSNPDSKVDAQEFEPLIFEALSKAAKIRGYSLIPEGEL